MSNKRQLPLFLDENERKTSWTNSEDENLPNENLEQLREEQGIKSYPEVDVPPESDEDLQNLPESDLNDNLLNTSGNSLLRSETRQNRNLATGSASSGRPLSATIDRAESLDDFEEEERKIQQELENSGDHTALLSGSLQNRQENYSSNEHRLADDEDYDSDYPDGIPVEYPTDPPPAYTSPPKFPVEFEQNMDQENMFHHDHPDDEDDEDEEEEKEEQAVHFGHATGLGALAAGGIALASGVGAMNRMTRKSVPIIEDNQSSQESYHYNDAIQDQSPTDRVRQLPPMSETTTSRIQSATSKKDEESPKSIYLLTNDLKNLFQVIERYQAISVEIEPYLIPFDVNYVPAVGDVHPGIGIPRPDEIEDFLGLVVLDEPSGKQSNSTVINMLLQQGKNSTDEPIKRIFRPDKNSKAIEQWIENIKEVRRSKPSDRMIYQKPMPDIEKLMEEWTPEMETTLRGLKLPNSSMDITTEEFADICLSYLDIPNHGNRIQSLHLMFLLYNEFKNSQHFRNAAYSNDPQTNTETDRLEL